MLIGGAGSGKGTQAEFLKETLGNDKTLYVYNGDIFRQLSAEKNNLTSDLMLNNVLETGALAPRFLAIWAWGDFFVKNLDKKSDIIVDGSPRTLLEAHALEEAFNFYGRDNKVLINIEVSMDESLSRLKKRARHDDTEEVILNRLKLYNEGINSIISFFKSDTNVNVFGINGVGSPEEVFGRIKKELF